MGPEPRKGEPWREVINAMPGLSTYFVPRDLHPGAWWLWALGLAVAASRTTNPWLLGMIFLVACHVVVARRPDAPWAMAFRLYLWLALLVVVIRVFFRFVFGGGGGETVLLSLPELTLPGWASGIWFFGEITAESLLGGLYDGLRLATMLICLGAANALANPKRLLKSMPPALYEVGTAIVVAMSVFPQLAESVVRVRRARKLRGDLGKGVRFVHAIVIPVLEDSLDRSLQLAASMDSRGYGRSPSAGGRTHVVTGVLMVTGLIGVCVGIYASLDSTAPRALATPVLLGGVVIAALGFGLAGRGVRRTRYRPDRWRAAEVITALSGITAAIVMFIGASADPANLYPSLTDLSWPPLPFMSVMGILVGILPAWLTPEPQPPFPDIEATPEATTYEQVLT